MSVKYLYYTEDADAGGSLSAAHAVPVLDQLLYLYGGSFMAIHPVDADYDPTAAEHYATLAAAEAAYPSHAWIYLDANASVYLDEVAPPADNVVYAVGHDLTGWGNEVPGDLYKIRTLRPEPFAGHAIIMLSLAAADRWTRMASWL